MQYDWEKKITQKTLRKINALLPDGLLLRGVAVENVMTAEAALIESPDVKPNIMAMADVWRDILGDADQHYETYRKQLFPSQPSLKGD